MTIAYIFPGQGSQKIGMAQDLYKEFDFIRSMFHEADGELNQNLTEIILKGPEELLTQTENTQPALMLASLAGVKALEHISNKKLADTGSFIAGHSLGEFSALTAGESISIQDCAKLLKIRGKAMQEAVPHGKGSMFALLGADQDIAKEICLQSSTDGICEIANDNTVGQLVLSGEVPAIEKAMEIAAEKKLKAIKLNVSAPFHCSMMKPAQTKLAIALNEINISRPSLNLIANVTADIETSPENIKKNLITQVTATVRWTQSIQKMIELGVTEFVEIGPGKVLSGLIKRINRDVKATSLQNLEDIYSFASNL